MKIRPLQEPDGKRDDTVPALRRRPSQGTAPPLG